MEGGLREVLEGVRNGTLSVDRALERLRSLPFEDLGFARVDHHRLLRTGLAEVIFCPGKEPGQIADIARAMLRHTPTVLATRADEAAHRALAEVDSSCRYYPLARLAVLGPNLQAPTQGTVLVACAGTADLPVAEEAAVTAEVLGNPVERLYDVGVAGLHRLLGHRNRLEAARVLVVVAGMEGALPSVVAGLVGRPVIAVPTSVGYGASLGGLAALLAMLNSCSPGVAVVNIDNGFGAAAMATLINRRFETGGEATGDRASAGRPDGRRPTR
ncbi:MAG: nickel pincer cofactor biosynthesis protein LarB [Acetobacteraceae bacterium]|nr:nickel pincer cofactor biosynthesis protein LarB [Acetobacteraceae bacterium]